MGILDRYIARIFWKFFAQSFLILFFLCMGGISLRQEIKNSHPNLSALQQSFYEAPEFIVLLLPIACLIGVILCLSLLCRHNELTALYTSTVSPYRIALILLSFSSLICCLSLIITDRVIPAIAQINPYNTDKGKSDTAIAQNYIWYKNKNTIYSLQAFDLEKRKVQGISIYNFNEKFELIGKIDANTAQDEGTSWLARNGKVIKFQKKPPSISINTFEKKFLFLLEDLEQFKEIEEKIETLRLIYLWKLIQKSRSVGINTMRHEMLFWSKVKLALLPLFIVIAAIPIGIKPKHPPSIAKDLVIGFFLLLAYGLFQSIFSPLGEMGILPPIVSVFLPGTILAILGGGIMLTKTRIWQAWKK